MQEYLDMWSNYANFEGRTSVRGYWMAVLFNFIVSLVLAVIANMLGTDILTSVYSVAVLVPSLALAVRRLRDTGRQWTSILIGLIPVVGWIVLIVWMCQPSNNARANNNRSNDWNYTDDNNRWN